MSSKNYEFNWSELAFSSKKSLRDLNAIFIAAPREISGKRFTQIIKQWLPKGNIVLGIAVEGYIDGFDGQPHFRSLKKKDIQFIINKVNKSNSPHKIHTLRYLQRDLNAILEKISFKHHLFINGSWHKTFHTLAPYYTLVNNNRSYELISPFSDETEARQYTRRSENEIKKAFHMPKLGSGLSEADMMSSAFRASTYSFDYSFQTGVSLGRKTKSGYTFLAATYNKVVPFQSYAMHYGASRETHFSPPHDVNHYDTVHAEVELILQAGRQKLNLKGTSFFISTLPCPTCARMLSQTDIKELIYQHDHSEGYAIKMLEATGKNVRRLTPQKAASNV